MSEIQLPNIGITRRRVRKDIFDDVIKWTYDNDHEDVADKLIESREFLTVYKYINYLLIINYFNVNYSYSPEYSIKKLNIEHNKLIKELEEREEWDILDYIKSKQYFYDNIKTTIIKLYENSILFPLFSTNVPYDNVTLYHGLEEIEFDIFTNIISKLQINDTFLLPTFMSTSFVREVATNFAWPLTENSNKILFEININKNVYNLIRYIYLSNVSTKIEDDHNLLLNSEYELLLILGSELKLTKITKNVNYTWTSRIEQANPHGGLPIMSPTVITQIFDVYTFEYVKTYDMKEYISQINIDFLESITSFGKNKLIKKSKRKKSKRKTSKELKKIQKLAKKNSIRITKTIKGKRIYKSKKELLKNLKSKKLKNKRLNK